MIRIELTDEEATFLKELLDSTFRELRQENYRTDVHDWKEDLRRREHATQSLLSKLQAGEGK